VTLLIGSLKDYKKEKKRIEFPKEILRKIVMMVAKIKKEHSSGQIQSDIRFFLLSMLDTSQDYRLLPIFSACGIKTDSLKASMNLATLQENALTKKIISLADLFNELPNLRSGNEKAIKTFIQRNKYLITERTVFNILMQLISQ
jgi:hypothetical protein